MIIRVLLPLYQLFPLDYMYDLNDELQVGDLVKVPFRSMFYTGIVWNTNLKQSEKSLKKVMGKIGYTLPFHNLQLIEWAANYYITSLGSIAKLVLPLNIEKIQSQPHERSCKKLTSANLYALSQEQNFALNSIMQSTKPTLIHGVTGSGKTEVYFHFISEILKNGGQALVMLPEIALTSQVTDRFEKAFASKPLMWHSSITQSQKTKAFHDIITGDSHVIIGARSSLFLPYKNLKCIIIDEEHDTSYKQDDVVLYNARDIAVLIGSILKIPVILLSATPSLESYFNAISGKYTLIQIKNRYQNVVMPEIKVINMLENKKKDAALSDDLICAMHETLRNGDQVLLYLNRRGYASLILCKACGYRIACKNCSVWMVWHKSKKRLQCHHCGEVSAKKDICSECQAENSFIEYGVGVERLYEEVEKEFKNARTIIVSSDIMTTKKKLEDTITKIKNKEVDIIIGTQIMVKGHHFPSLNLVGIVDADIDSMSGDIRSNEKNFQVINQVSGRAGRESSGMVIVQTVNPENPVIKLMLRSDFESFASMELEFRKNNRLPPFEKMVSIIISCAREDTLTKFVASLAYLVPKHDSVKMLGPTSALIARLNNKHRQRILLIGSKSFNFSQYIKEWLLKAKIPSSVHIKIDVDPYSFY